MPRLFIAIEFKPSFMFEAASRQLRQKLEGSNIKWVAQKNFHITLKFLGDVEEYYMNSLTQILEDISLANSAFTLKSDSFGFYGKKSNPRVIWYGFHSNPQYTVLQSSVEDSLIQLGFAKEGKYDPPHMTLGRVKRILPSHDFPIILQELQPAHEDYPVSRFNLIKSTLSNQGSVYTMIRDYSLRKA